MKNTDEILGEKLMMMKSGSVSDHLASYSVQFLPFLYALTSKRCRIDNDDK